MAALGRVIAQFLIASFIDVLGSLVGRVMLAAGIGVVSYFGMDTSLAFFKSGVIASFSSLPSSIVGLLGLMNVGSCISMVFSAMVMRMAFSGMTSGAVKRFVKK